jgi:hypothetical protein
MHLKTARRGFYAVIAWMVVIGLFLAPAPVQAGSITIDLNQAQSDFPRNITFRIKAKASANIERVTLLYGVSAESCLNSQARHAMIFDPATSIDLSWEWDLFRSGDLPPGVEVWWQWQIRAADGTELLTDVARMTVEDPNFEWKTLTRGQITILWAEGSNAFGAEMLDIAVTSLERLATTSNLTASGSIRLALYPSTDDLKKAMLRTTEWMGGVAFWEYRVVLLAVSPDGDRQWPKEAIPHELAHVVFGQRIANCLGADAPSWLNEGMAMYAEGPVTAAEREPVLAELRKGSLQAFTTIERGFPADARRANLAYSQSKLLVDFMIETYGKEQLEALLDQFKNGERTDDALRAVYGLDTQGLDLTWRASLGFGTAPQPDFSTPTPAARATAIPTMALVSPLQTQGPATLTPTTAPAAPTEAVAQAATATAGPALTAAATATGSAAPPAADDSQTAPRLSNLLLLVGGVCAAAVLLVVIVAVVLLLKRRSKQT